MDLKRLIHCSKKAVCVSRIRRTGSAAGFWNKNDESEERKMTIEKIENMCGGEGCVVIKHILGKEELNGKCGLYAEVTIGKGCSLGYHEHHGESETYYILSGKGDYNDNGAIRPVTDGDVTFTPSGRGHGLVNTGDDDLIFMALIILD